MATRRTGKPYIWVTWLAKLLGGNECLWSAWFKAHFKYEKFQEMASDLVEWNREHNALMARRRRDLEADGWTVTSEDQNAFKLEGASAVVAGKPDLIATKPGFILTVDGKTGRQRDSDIWQVLFYLFAIQKARPDLVGELTGEVHYGRNDEVITVTPDQLTDARMGDIVALIKTIAGETPPRKVPSRHECQRCDIGRRDCPQRVTADQEMTAVGEF